MYFVFYINDINYIFISVTGEVVGTLRTSDRRPRRRKAGLSCTYHYEIGLVIRAIYSTTLYR